MKKNNRKGLENCGTLQRKDFTEHVHLDIEQPRQCCFRKVLVLQCLDNID